MHVIHGIDRHADAADFAVRARAVGVDAHLRGQIERDRQSCLSVVQQQAKPPVGLLGRAEPGVLAHGPQPAAVHRGLDAPRERKRARIRQVVRVVGGAVLRTVDSLYGDSRWRRAVGQALTSSGLFASVCAARSTSFLEPM